MKKKYTECELGSNGILSRAAVVYLVTDSHFPTVEIAGIMRAIVAPMIGFTLWIAHKRVAKACPIQNYAPSERPVPWRAESKPHQSSQDGPFGNDPPRVLKKREQGNSLIHVSDSLDVSASLGDRLD